MGNIAAQGLYPVRADEKGGEIGALGEKREGDGGLLGDGEGEGQRGMVGESEEDRHELHGRHVPPYSRELEGGRVERGELG